MKSRYALPLAIALSVTTGFALAGTPAPSDEHHPSASASASSKASVKASAKSADPAPKADDPMKAMHDMHEKMMAAKTPEERKALMAEHMKTMHDGMSMMNGMMESGAAKPMSPQALQKRMDMMQMMMQMMMDRMDKMEAAAPGMAK